MCNTDFTCNPTFLTLKNPKVSETGPLIMGLLKFGTDPLGKIYINVLETSDLELKVGVAQTEEVYVEAAVSDVNY